MYNSVQFKKVSLPWKRGEHKFYWLQQAKALISMKIFHFYMRLQYVNWSWEILVQVLNWHLQSVWGKYAFHYWGASSWHQWNNRLDLFCFDGEFSQAKREIRGQKSRIMRKLELSFWRESDPFIWGYSTWIEARKFLCAF